MSIAMHGQDLPINAVLPQLDAALSGKDFPPRAVVTAAPGAGKSTLLPLHLLKADWARCGRILLLEPRRLAARSIARRMAALLGEEVGQTIGYAMRMENNYSAKTRILVMTEGSFTRLILDNPELEGVCAVLFDEFHERSLDADFGLALALDAANALRPDMRLLIMSATLDSGRAAALLALEGGQSGGGQALPAPIIAAQGRSFPVELVYCPRGQGLRGAGGSRPEPIEEAVAKACGKALRMAEGGILAFLPGQAEIKRVCALLEAEFGGAPDILIAPLYGGLPALAQENAIKPAPQGQRKIVLATSIAESALTIEDIRIVVDSGLARLPVYDSESGITRLKTVRASRASHAQRAGRAGRLAPGWALRLWRKEQESSAPAFTPPEIAAANLSGLLLDCADFGIADPLSLHFLDKPPAAACAAARRELQALEALDKDGRITPLGRALRRLSLPPALAAMLLAVAGQGREQGSRAARLAVLLTEAGLGGSAEDLDARLENFSRDGSPRARQMRRLAQNLAEKAALLTKNRPQAAHKGKAAPQQKSGAGEILAAAWWGRVAHLRPADEAQRASGRGDKAAYILANGRGAFLDKTSPLYGAPWLICAELSGQAANCRIRAAARLSEAWLRENLADKISRETSVFFDAESGALRALRQSRLGAIELENQPQPPPQGDAANLAWLEALQNFGLGILPWGKESEALRARLAFLHAVLGAPWPDVSDAALLSAAAEWLLPHLPGAAAFKPKENGFLAAALAALPPPMLQRQAEILAPLYFTAPTGSRLPIRYEGACAALAVRVQELFGLKRQPMLAGGRVPLLLELLSPAGRILQITRDIAGFWQGSWHEVAAEMRGRYPKHFWPKDAANAAPARKARPRAQAEGPSLK